jgi:ferric-dicitrate binding protein FerR (iron transport regulator)
MDANQFSDLLKRYRLGTCTEEERKWVEGWYNERRNNIYNPLTNEEEALAGERMYGNVMTVLSYETPKNVVPLWRQSKVWWVAAGTIFIMATAGYFVMNNKPVVTKTAEVPKQPVVQPVLPGGNKAVLTLADGSTIVLDSAANGALTQQGNSQVIKTENGELVYEEAVRNSGTPLTTHHSPLAYNSISTPRGGQYQIVLPDGTRVWLNAVSSLRFPASFTGNEREVQLTGEAYFEVAGQPLSSDGKRKKPFIVTILPTAGNAEGSKVEVLGTHFNIKAYNDESAIKTTLLEGAVSMSTSKTRRVLKPGQQAQAAKDGQMIVDEDADTDEAIAWKNGRFQFTDASVETVMREIARWYDVEIVYAGKVPAEKFEGEIPRNSNITEVFRILELSNVHCKIEGKKITVLP